MAPYYQQHNQPRRGVAPQHQPHFLMRGAVVFVPLPQTLSSGRPEDVTHKTRPVVVMNKSVTYRLGSNGHVTSPFSFIGVPGTSKDYVVEGRPYTTFVLPPRDITTYAHADGIRTVMAEDALRPTYHLKPPEIVEMQQKLDAVLQPEPGFYRRRFFSNQMAEGQMWIIKTHGDDRERQAMILLRRGQHFMGDDGETPDPQLNGRTHYTPYLMAVFRTAERVTNLRGIGWNDVEILAVHERSFKRHVGEMQKDSVEAVVNNLRQQVGLKPIQYKQPPIRSASTVFGYLARLSMYIPH